MSTPPLSLTLPIDLDAYLRLQETAFITTALERADWNKTEAAKLLLMKRTTLVMRVKRLGLKRTRFV